MPIGLAADGNHKTYKMSEAKGTRAEDCKGSVEDGEGSSRREYTPPLHPNRSPRSRNARSAAEMKKMEDEEKYANIGSQ